MCILQRNPQSAAHTSWEDLGKPNPSQGCLTCTCVFRIILKTTIFAVVLEGFRLTVYIRKQTTVQQKRKNLNSGVVKKQHRYLNHSN